MISDSSTHGNSNAIFTATLRAVGCCTLPTTEIPKLRRQPTSLPAAALALRNADEQTIAALMVVRQCMADAGWQDSDIKSFGIIVSPRYFGRMGTASFLYRYSKQGPVGITPMAVPCYSLHSASGTLSVALGMHGPNFGAGGGPNHVRDGFFSAIGLNQERLAPCTWLVMTAYDQEPELDEQGRSLTPGAIYAVALAIQHESDAAVPWQLNLHTNREALEKPMPLSDLVAFLQSGDSTWRCPFSGGVIELVRRAQDDCGSPSEAPIPNRRAA